MGASQDVENGRMRAQGGIPLNRMVLPQHLPQFRVWIVQIAEDHGPGVAAGFHAGRLQALPQALGAEIAFFHHTSGPGREVLVFGALVDKGPRIAPVETAAAVGAGGHAEAAADAAVEVHYDNAVLIAEGRMNLTKYFLEHLFAILML